MRRFVLANVILVIISVTNSCTAAPIVPYLFNIDNYKGKVVYLDFWASWCGPCKFSFPYMQGLENRYGSKGLVIFADNLDHDSARADTFLRDNGIQLPIIYDQKGVLASRYKVEDMPTSILFDRHGRIRYVHKGFYKDKESEYTSHIIKLLNEK